MQQDKPSMNIDVNRYFLKLGAAFVRGRRAQGQPMELPEKLAAALLEELPEADLALKQANPPWLYSSVRR